MNRKERTEQKMQELFHSHAAGEEGTDPEFMQILQGYIFCSICVITQKSFPSSTRSSVIPTINGQMSFL